jgi:hypothetical protein
MDLAEYFDSINGTGIFSSADSSGRTNGAIYAKPHVLKNGQIGFIMRDRLSHHNLQSNPRAHYLFVENGGKSHGIRLHLQMVEETDDAAIVERYSRRSVASGDGEQRFFVTFTILKALQLLGDKEISLDPVSVQ